MWVGPLGPQCILIRNFLAVLPPPTLYVVETLKNFWIRTHKTLYVGWGEGLGLFEGEMAQKRIFTAKFFVSCYTLCKLWRKFGCFCSFNHLSRPLRKHMFTWMSSKGHGLLLVDFYSFGLFQCVSRFNCLWSSCFRLWSASLLHSRLTRHDWLYKVSRIL